MERGKFNPKVSIVIPVYNGSNYLREAIDSALAQTYKNTEVIVINDGSKDEGKTDEICKSYGNKIRYFKKENGGVATALNLGIEKMEGEYFSWLSHDDVYYPDKVQKQIDYLSNFENKSDVVLYSDYELIDNESQGVREVQLNPDLLKNKPEYGLLRAEINEITILLSKEVFERYGLFNSFVGDIHFYEMLSRIMKDFTFIHMEEVLVKTRIQPKNYSGNYREIIKERDLLWVDMMKLLNKKDRERVEGTEYNFYKQMNIFLLQKTYFEEACDFTNEQMRMKREEVKDASSNVKVSIIIPFYGNNPCLLESLKSAQRQTHENLEIILVNDGTKEDIHDLKEYVKKDSRCEIVNLKNNYGPGKARNVGIERATGKYIAFLDSDDLFLSRKIEEQLIRMELTGFQVSHTSYIRRDGDGERKVLSGKLDGYVIPEIISSCSIATPTVMIERKYLIEEGFRFREDIRIGEDVCFWLEILRDRRLLGIEDTYTVVNIDKNSSSVKIEKHSEGLINILEFILSDKEFRGYYGPLSTRCSTMGEFLRRRDFKQMARRLLQDRESGNCSFLRFDPKVSIVIPVYNGSNYLREAIDSALAQTYKNIEVIVINDGSKDKGATDKICKSYGNKIRYFKKENGGVASALNMGIEKMEGEYFSWLSHDDIYYSNKIEKQIRFLAELEEKDVVLYASYELIDEDSNTTKRVVQDHELLKNKPEYSLLRGRVNGITMLVPKKALETHGRFNEELRCTQDYDMWRRIAKGYNFVHMDEIFTKTRIHALQDSNKYSNVVKEGNVLWIKMMEALAKEDKIRLEGTEYNFYREIKLFLEVNSPYDGAAKFAEKKMEEIFNREKNQGKVKGIKVSVIIPFYNGVSDLTEALESVLKQSHEKLEVLLINDGSDVEIGDLGKRVKDDSRCRIINLDKNYGPAKARNIGIEESKGEYIAFLDSDDLFLPEKIEEQLLHMQLTGSKVSHTSYTRMENGAKKVVYSGKLDGCVIPQIIESCTIATPTVMIKRQFLEDNDFKFKEDLRIGEDTCFWLEILRNEEILGIDKPLTAVNVDSTSARNDSEKHLEGLKNILAYILNDEEYSEYYQQIAQLCSRYAEVAGNLALIRKGNHPNKRRENVVERFIRLSKYQGFSLTVRKILRKYTSKIISKITKS